MDETRKAAKKKGDVKKKGGAKSPLDNHTDKELQQILTQHQSWIEIQNAIGYSKPQPTYIRTIKRRLQRAGIAFEHINGNKMPKPKPSRPLEPFLRGEKKWRGGTVHMKNRLIAEGHMKCICVWCGIGPMHNNHPLVLELDHINGENSDYRLENLRILCPNCHSQTPTYCVKRSKKRAKNK